MNVFTLNLGNPAPEIFIGNEMNLVSVIVVLIVIGVVLWLINNYVPMQPPFKTIVNVLIVLVLCLWLLSFIGIIPLHMTSR